MGAPRNARKVRRYSEWLAIVGLLLLGSASVARSELIGADGLVSGDLSASSTSVGGSPCLSGAPLGGVLAGDLGPAPSGSFAEIVCVEIANDQPVERRVEIAFSGIPLPRRLDLTTTDGLVLIGPNERHLASQFDVLSRWGGPMDDPSLPIRWLQVSVPAVVGPNGTARYSLRRYDSLPPVADPFAAAIIAQGANWRVDTGLATVVLDPNNPALVESIAIDGDDDGAGRTAVYDHSGGAGPKLIFDDDGPVVLDTTDPDHVVVDPGGFEIVERGPVRVVVKLKGHQRAFIANFSWGIRKRGCPTGHYLMRV